MGKASHEKQDNTMSGFQQKGRLGEPGDKEGLLAVRLTEQLGTFS